MKKYNRIAIEGGEGVGKSTVLNILKKNLDPETTLFVKEPYEKSSVAGDIIRWRKGERFWIEIEQTELMAKIPSRTKQSGCYSGNQRRENCCF